MAKSNEKLRMELEDAITEISVHEYDRATIDMVTWLARNGFIRKRMAAFVIEYMDGHPIEESMDPLSRIWLREKTEELERKLGIPEEDEDEQDTDGDHD